MIEHTKKLVEERFRTVGGYDHNAEVHFSFLLIIKFENSIRVIFEAKHVCCSAHGFNCRSAQHGIA